MNVENSRQVLRLCIVLFFFASLRSVHLTSFELRPSFSPFENTASFVASAMSWRGDDAGGAGKFDAVQHNMWMRRIARSRGK
jgi:hypothetical protein